MKSLIFIIVLCACPELRSDSAANSDSRYRINKTKVTNYFYPDDMATFLRGNKITVSTFKTDKSDEKLNKYVSSIYKLNAETAIPVVPAAVVFDQKVIARDGVVPVLMALIKAVAAKTIDDEWTPFSGDKYRFLLRSDLENGESVMLLICTDTEKVFTYRNNSSPANRSSVIADKNSLIEVEALLTRLTGVSFDKLRIE